MKRGRRILAIVGGAALLAAVAAFIWPREREPEYNGRTLSEWLNLCGDSTQADVRERAEAAVLQIGERGCPVLLAWIRAVPMSYGNVYKLANKLPRGRMRSWLLQRAAGPAMRRMERGYYAVSAFGILGPKGAWAIPELVRIANRRQPTYASMFAVWALMCVGTNGVVALRGLDREQVVDDLTLCAVMNPRAKVRAAAVAALGNFGDHASRSAVPSLVSALRDSDTGVRLAATNLLERIAPEVLRAYGTTGADVTHGTGAKGD